MSVSMYVMSKEELQNLTGNVQVSNVFSFVLACQMHALSNTLCIGPMKLTLSDGKIVGVENLHEQSIGTGLSLEQVIGYFMQQGETYDVALGQVGKVIIENLRQLGTEDVSVSVVAMESNRPIELTVKLSHLIIDFLQSTQDDVDLLREYSHGGRYRLTWLVDSTNITKVGLTMPLLRFYRASSACRMLSEAVTELSRVTDSLRMLDVLVGLGILQVEQPESHRERRRLRRERRREEQRNDAAQSNVPNEISSSSEDSEVSETHLRLAEMHQKLFVDSVPAYKIFGLTAPNEVNDTFLDEAFRNLSFQWHPDRFNDGRERDLATDIFTQLNELYNELGDEDTRVELRKRLDVERRGEQYVSTEDEARSVVLLEQGRFFFKKRKFQESFDILTQAIAINPYNWRINTYLVRCEAELGLKTKLEVADILENNKDARGTDRVSILFQAGEYYFQSDSKAKAYEVFQKVVELDESHIDAKRYLHLRRRNQSNASQDTENEESTGFFSRLFGRK